MFYFEIKPKQKNVFVITLWFPDKKFNLFFYLPAESVLGAFMIRRSFACSNDPLLQTLLLEDDYIIPESILLCR